MATLPVNMLPTAISALPLTLASASRAPAMTISSDASFKEPWVPLTVKLDATVSIVVWLLPPFFLSAPDSAARITPYFSDSLKPSVGL